MADGGPVDSRPLRGGGPALRGGARRDCDGTGGGPPDRRAWHSLRSRCMTLGAWQEKPWTRGLHTQHNVWLGARTGGRWGRERRARCSR